MQTIHSEKELYTINIIINANGASLSIAMEGRLDAATAPRLEAELKNPLSGATDLAFGFARLDNISSAGLWVLPLYE